MTNRAWPMFWSRKTAGSSQHAVLAAATRPARRSARSGPRAPRVVLATLRGRHQTTPGRGQGDHRPGGQVEDAEVAHAGPGRPLVAPKAPDRQPGRRRQLRRRGDDPARAEAASHRPRRGAPGRARGRSPRRSSSATTDQVASLLDRLRVDEALPDREEVEVDRREEDAADGGAGATRPGRPPPAPGRPPRRSPGPDDAAAAGAGGRGGGAAPRRPGAPAAHALARDDAPVRRPRPQASTGRSTAAWTTAPAARVRGSPTAVRARSSVHGPPTRADDPYASKTVALWMM